MKGKANALFPKGILMKGKAITLFPKEILTEGRECVFPKKASPRRNTPKEAQAVFLRPRKDLNHGKAI